MIDGTPGCLGINARSDEAADLVKYTPIRWKMIYNISHILFSPVDGEAHRGLMQAKTPKEKLYDSKY